MLKATKVDGVYSDDPKKVQNAKFFDNLSYDEFEEDDGISHIKEGGLTLVIGYEKQEDNSYKLTASVK